MDIFCLSSISEGISLSILEAMSAGLPVVATNVGGNPEIIEHKKTGFLVESNNPYALAKALLYLLKNENYRKNTGKTARKKVEEQFNFKKMVKNYEKLYISMIKQ